MLRPRMVTTTGRAAGGVVQAADSALLKPWMMQEWIAQVGLHIGERSLVRAANVLLGGWVIGSQVWYYGQFAGLLRGFVASVFRHR